LPPGARYSGSGFLPVMAASRSDDLRMLAQYSAALQVDSLPSCGPADGLMRKLGGVPLTSARQ
jgi:hypothetical protein